MLGKFKDKYASLAVQEFVGLRSKMYSILLPCGKAKFTAKGVSRRHVLKHLKHEHYLQTLKTIGSSFLKYRTVRSYKHILKTIEINKNCLSTYDDKRYILPDGVHTFGHGHFRIADLKAQVGVHEMEVDELMNFS